MSEKIAYANPRVKAFSQYLMRDDQPRKGKGLESLLGLRDRAAHVQGQEARPTTGSCCRSSRRSTARSDVCSGTPWAPIRRRRRADDRRGRRALPRPRRLRARTALTARRGRLAANAAPDLVVLDIMLPGLDGLEVMRRLRERADLAERVAVILLTAKGEESDRVIGLRLGADDYVVKPFSPAELVARVDAVLRRDDPAPERRRRSCTASWRSTRPRGRCVGGEEVELTQREFDLLQFLARHPGQVFTPRPADGRGLAVRVLHRHDRRSRSTSDGCGRRSSRPGAAALDRDRVGRRLPLPADEVRGARRGRLVTGAVIAPVYGAALVTGVLVSAIAAVGLALAAPVPARRSDCSPALRGGGGARGRRSW